MWCVTPILNENSDSVEQPASTYILFDSVGCLLQQFAGKNVLFTMEFNPT